MNIFRQILSLCIVLLFSLLNSTAFASTPEASAYGQDNAEDYHSTAYVCGQTVGTGCVLATVPMTHGLDTYQTGWRKLITGEHHATVSAQGLMGLGLSETNAELLYGAMALSSEVLAARAFLRATSNPVVAGLGGRVDDVALATNTAPTGGLGPMRRSVDDPNLDAILDSNYGNVSINGARIGNGGTADALRYENATGKLLSPSGHLQKAIELRTRLQTYLRRATNSPNPNSAGTTFTQRDIDYVNELIRDLDNAIGD